HQDPCPSPRAVDRLVEPGHYARGLAREFAPAGSAKPERPKLVVVGDPHDRGVRTACRSKAPSDRQQIASNRGHPAVDAAVVDAGCTDAPPDVVVTDVDGHEPGSCALGAQEHFRLAKL